MKNTTLIFGAALRFVEKKYPENEIVDDLNKQRYLQIRVYCEGGEDFFFIHGQNSAKWYYQEKNLSNYHVADDSYIAKILDPKEKRSVQLCTRRLTFGTWNSWSEFLKAINC